jgi:hypothetical protein
MRSPAQAASPKSQALIGAALCKPAHDLLIDLFGVGHDPIHGLLFGGKTVDAALVAFVIPDDDVPAGAFLVGKGQHDWLFFFGVRHGAEYARFGRGRKCKSRPVLFGLPAIRTVRKFVDIPRPTRNKRRLFRIANM